MSTTDEGQGVPPEGEEHAPLDAADEAFGVTAEHRPKKRKIQMAGENISELNLTPMMDIMTILLVFLVMSFATDPGAINVEAGKMRPPQSTATDKMDPATRVTISTEDIQVEANSVKKLADIPQNSKSPLIPEVRDALLKEKEKTDTLAQRGWGPEFSGQLLVVADESTPYWLMSAVLWSAGQAQYKEYKLVVIAKTQ